LHWFLKAKLSSQRLKLLLSKLKRRLKPLLPGEEPFLVRDTTGISFRRKSQKLKWLRGRMVKETRGHGRFCSLMKYFQKARLLLVEGMEVGYGYASDARLGLEVLDDAEGKGLLLADGCFDSIAIIRKARKRGFKLLIKLKGGGEIKDEWRREVKEAFDTASYQSRSVVEGIFGGIKTKMNGPLRCLDVEVTRKEASLEALTYNIRVYFSLFLLRLHLRPLPLALQNY
jgi:hypothetical protein